VTYRERLRLEGAALAGSGALSAALVLAFSDGATDGPVSTVVQLVAVAVLMATAGVWSVRRSMRSASSLPDDEVGSGEPTPLWQLPAICAGLTLAFGFGVGWDAGLRIGGGCVIVGLAQAVLFERLVAREEARQGVRFFRVPGSSLFTGTKLGAAR
jgi:hypothetical protein